MGTPVPALFQKQRHSQQLQQPAAGCHKAVDKLPHFEPELPEPEPPPLPSPSFFSSAVASFNAFWIFGSLMSTPGREPNNSWTKSGSCSHFWQASSTLASPSDFAAAAGSAFLPASASTAMGAALSPSASCIDSKSAWRNSSSMSSMPPPTSLR